MIEWPTKDSITEILITNIIGPGKTISDLGNQWIMKHLIIAIREAVWMLIIVLKAVYESYTVRGAKGDRLDELGIERGVYRKTATKAIHSVTLKKSSAVSADYAIPDNFLLTTTPIGVNIPVQFRVIPEQYKVIPAGYSLVAGVLVECTVEGQVGNVSNGSINLVAQAGIDSVADSILVEVGADREEDGPYRERILLRKQNENRGGTPDDWKNWAESVEGVISATVFPRNRGNGTVDVLVAGQNGFPDQVLIDKVQEYLDSKTPADIADGGVLVVAPTGVTVDVTLSNCVWREGYDSTSGAPIVESTIKEYINKQANLDRVIRVTRLINIASSAYDPVDSDKRPILLDFSMLGPKENHILANTEMSLPGSILLS